ncbi:MAG: GTPase HflX [Micrococcaceae bacterium]
MEVQKKGINITTEDFDSQNFEDQPSNEPNEEQLQAIVNRVIERSAQPKRSIVLTPLEEEHAQHDGLQQDLEDRRARRRIQTHSTELEDVTEVEYRQLRLEKVILAALRTTQSEQDVINSILELEALAETAGSEVLDTVIQKRMKPDAGTYFGSGKAEEIRALVQARSADTVIVDDELAPSQRRALEDIIKVKVIDRTALILDIFSQHAKSREGKAQVEYAQMEYMLPRLRGWGESLSRQAGGRVAAGAGIGSRGPGETQIELDRRKIRQRMAKLRKEIAGMKPARETKRKNRKRNKVPSVVIAGYTNAGKSSLLNRLTHAGVLVENALFATLDPTVRQAQTPDGIAYTLADTVGFVRNLPTQLVEAFRSTLEEVEDSDLILHTVDVSHPNPESQIAAVREVLSEIGARKIPEIIVLNKADIADPFVIERIKNTEHNCVVVSTRTGEGITELEQKISDMIPRPDIEIQALVPYSEGKLINQIHEHGEMIDTKHNENGTLVHAKVTPELDAQLEHYKV